MLTAEEYRFALNCIIWGFWIYVFGLALQMIGGLIRIYLIWRDVEQRDQ